LPNQRPPCAPDIRAAIPFGAAATALFRWLRNTIEKNAAQGGDWRSIVDGIRPFTQEIWQNLAVSSRRSLLEHARSWWDVHRHRMAPEVEARINDAIASGCRQADRDRAGRDVRGRPLPKKWPIGDPIDGSRQDCRLSADQWRAVEGHIRP
jgi:uncharacterized NAD(P)/FAD-binding protein YdhS